MDKKDPKFLKTPKYAIGDIIQLKTNKLFTRKIMYICEAFYDETGLSEEIYYYTKMIDNDLYPPLPIKESTINTYYNYITCSP
jgi:hypothetical protein